MTPLRSTGKQRGVVMVIALIMLLAVTLMVVTAANLVQANLKVVQNMESRELVRSAALATIEEAISSLRFTEALENIFLDPCLENNQQCYDYNGDGVNDVKVKLSTPRCITVTPIKNSELNVYENPLDASCHLAATVYSMCAASVWEFEAVATDIVTGAKVTVRQGVSVKTTLNKVETACPL
jgi:hypothetical protein